PEPSRKNDVRQFQCARIQASRGKESAAPSREPEKRTPLARPRWPTGSQLQMARVLPGKAPASPMPNKKRMATRDVRLQAAPVSAVRALQDVTTAASTIRGPKRSANQPEGIWAMA